MASSAASTHIGGQPLLLIYRPREPFLHERRDNSIDLGLFEACGGLSEVVELLTKLRQCGKCAADSMLANQSECVEALASAVAEDPLG